MSVFSGKKSDQWPDSEGLQIQLLGTKFDKKCDKVSFFGSVDFIFASTKQVAFD